jgi:predicted TIM-barrel fold metal-dependent hydrolase
MTVSPELLPDPPVQPRKYPIISVDDHVFEPPDLFTGRMPAALADQAPRRISDQTWLFEGKELKSSGLENVAGRETASWSPVPIADDEMRRGAWDIHARVADMDLDGVYAQTCFPSGAFGWAGKAFSGAADGALGLAGLRAYNAWHLEYLAGTYPGRIVPMQMVWLRDPAVAADDIRKNAAAGFRAATFPDLPQYLDLPRISDPYWNPVLEALEETETVVSLHLGGGGWVIDPYPMRTAESAHERDYTRSVLFPGEAMVGAVEWLFSGVLPRFPGLKLAWAEGGIGWVPMVIDRLDYMASHSGVSLARDWKSDLSPVELLRERFWFCMLDNPSNLAAHALIGSDHIMVESDYPHSDSTWPGTQKLFADRFRDLPTDIALDMTYRTAEKLFRHPVPASWIETTEIHA